jgi:outer membrane immunogenic protein
MGDMPLDRQGVEISLKFKLSRLGDKMKKFLTAAAFVALSSATAFAADLPMKAHMLAPAPVFSWTGFYVGGHVGAGWGTTESNIDVGRTLTSTGIDPVSLALVLPLAQTQMNGFLGGIQAGYNWQSGLWVFGIEGDFSGADIKGTAPCLLVLNCSSKVNWTADITGRLGVTVGAGGLLYVKGGAAWINRKFSVSNSIAASAVQTDFSTLAGDGGIFAGFGAVNGSVTNTRLGALLGAGIEYNVPTTNWSVKLEYDYMQFESQNVNVPFVASGGVTYRGGPPQFVAVPFNANVNLNDQVHTVKVGANYHFN